MNALRRLKRGIAKVNMKKAGYHQICKKHGDKHSSAFAEKWRDFAKPMKVVQRRTRRGRGAGKVLME